MIKWCSDRDLYLRGECEDVEVYFDRRRGKSLRTSSFLAPIVKPFVECWFTLKQTPWMPYKVYIGKVSEGTYLICFGLFESMIMMDK